MEYVFDELNDFVYESDIVSGMAESNLFKEPMGIQMKRSIIIRRGEAEEEAREEKKTK